MKADFAPLTVRFQTHQSIVVLDDNDLERVKIEHESDIVKLAGMIDASDDAIHRGKCRRIRQVLLRNLQWINRESKARDAVRKQRAQEMLVEAAKIAREETAEQIAARVAANNKARLDRIRASNDVNSREIAIFKSVAREVLGDEMYLHLWELTKMRIAEAGKPEQVTA